MKDLIKLFFIILIIFSPLLAWITHVFSTIQNEQWGFLIAGAIFFPIGVIHGFGLWFGIF